MTRVAVTAPFFCKSPILRAELQERYEDVTFNDEDRNLRGDELVEFLKGHDKAIVAMDFVDDAVLAQLPDIKVVSKYGVGLDAIDLKALAARGILLGWTGGVNRRAVSELTLSFIITLLRRAAPSNRDMRDGAWKRRTGLLLTDKTVGIIGCGFIGKDLTGLLKPFGCRVLANDIRDYAEFYRDNGVEPVGLEELLKASDVVTLHVPLDASTRNILSAERLALMKPEAVLINNARGGLIDEDALKVMLAEGRLAGAACDAFNVEPTDDAELVNLPNFWGTPHMGAATSETALALGRAAIEGLDAARLPGPDWLDAWE